MKYQLLTTALIASIAATPYDRTNYPAYDSPNPLSSQEIIENFEAIGTDKYINSEAPPVGDYEQGLVESSNKDTPPTSDYESFQAEKEAELANLLSEIDNLMSNFDSEGDNLDILGLIKDGASAIWQKVKDFKEKFYG